MHITKKKRLFVLAFFVLAGLLLSAQKSPKDEQSPPSQVFRADTRLVQDDKVLHLQAVHDVAGIICNHDVD